MEPKIIKYDERNQLYDKFSCDLEVSATALHSFGSVANDLVSEVQCIPLLLVGAPGCCINAKIS